jgi:hypothetical protein
MIDPKVIPLSSPSLLPDLSPAERLVAVHRVQGFSNKEACSPAACFF